ncbi:hypothetical protein U1Q18_040188 [Sarracenia purpurea var. burkii]
MLLVKGKGMVPAFTLRDESDQELVNLEAAHYLTMHVSSLVNVQIVPPKEEPFLAIPVSFGSFCLSLHDLMGYIDGSY